MAFLLRPLACSRPLATIAVTQAAELKAAGLDVIQPWRANRISARPRTIKDAAIARSRPTRRRYAAVDGIAGLKKAICAKFEQGEAALS